MFTESVSKGWMRNGHTAEIVPFGGGDREKYIQYKVGLEVADNALMLDSLTLPNLHCWETPQRQQDGLVKVQQRYPM